MKMFTKHFLALLLMVIGVVSVSAKTEQVHATFENPSNTNTTWDAETRTFTWSTTYYNQLRNIGLPNGDITKYKKLVVDCTIKSGDQFRILFYKGGSNLTLYAQDGVNEFIIKDALEAVAPNDYNEYLLACDEICLSGNNGAAPGEAVINDVYLETYDDEGQKVYATFESPSNTNTTWDAETKTFTWSTTYYNQLRNIGLPNGDISGYKKLVVDCTIKSGDQFRILFYKGGSNLTLYAQDGVNEFIIKDALEAVAPNDYNEYLLACDEICLSGNNGAAPGEAVINSVYLETYPENESVEVPEIEYEEDPGKPAGNFIDFTEAFPDLSPRIGIGEDTHPIVMGNGEVVVGQRTNNVIADLSDYSALTIVATPGLKLVAYMNHEIEAKQNASDYTEEDAGKYEFIELQAGEDGLCTLDLTQYAKQDLNCLCLPWDNTNKGTVWYLLLTENAPEPALADGKYYLKNVGANLYWGAGNTWGTQASLISEQQYATLAALEDGTYTLESMVSNGGNQYYFNGSYMDNGSPVSLTITKLDNGNYTIANGDVFYGYDGTSTVLANLTSGEDANAQWSILKQDDIDAENAALIATASATNPVDVTFLVKDAYFGRNRRDAGEWTMEAGNKNLTGGGDKGGCAESYHSTFSLSQVVANAPKGVYKLGASAFYRQDGTDEENLPYIYITDGTDTATSPFGVRTGTENNMNEAANAFNNGLYVLDPAFFELSESGDITVGAKLEENATLWCIWGRFTLSYYGPDADIASILFGDLAAKVEELRTQATELKDNSDVPATAVTALEDALAASENIAATEEAYNAAIAALQDAVGSANAFVKAKPILDAMKAEIDKTNVYTAEAYEEYYGQWAKKFDEGTLTAAEAQNLQDPSVVTGWHAGITVDNFLLSAWDTNPDFVDAPYYINSWSIEGDNDGTGFHVPFFEYWTGDDNSLGEKTLTATLSEVPAGEYVVSAWVRVRAKNGTDAADATGITLAANGGEAVDVTEGEAVGQFNLGEYKANATVGEDGELKIQFNVAADNNISWLSFKNVKYMTLSEAIEEELAKNYEKALPNIEDGKSYQITTKVGENTYYLMSDGKLTANAAEATNFEFKAVNVAGTKYETGWNLGCRFTNPSLTNGSSGDIVQVGGVRVDPKNDRDDWERQAFFYDGENYAVRSTNANSTAWGGNTYWTIVDAEAELPEAGHSLEPSYVWQLTEVTIAPEVPEDAWFTDSDISFKVNDYPNGVDKEAVADPRWTVDPTDESNGCIIVTSNDAPANDYDAQLFIVLPEKLKEGTELTLTMRVRADRAQAGCGAQAHNTPGDYNHWGCVSSIDFTTEWADYSSTITVSAAMEKGQDGNGTKDGMGTIAFNLSDVKGEKISNNFYFDDIEVVYTIPTALKGIDTATQKANGKYFQNSQIFIMKNGVKYNAAGVMVK